jgi:hypothetical protein
MKFLILFKISQFKTKFLQTFLTTFLNKKNLNNCIGIDRFPTLTTLFQGSSTTYAKMQNPKQDPDPKWT